MVKTNIKGAAYCAEKLYEALAYVAPSDDKRPEASPYPPAKQRITPDNAALTKAVQLKEDPTKVVKIGAQLGGK